MLDKILKFLKSHAHGEPDTGSDYLRVERGYKPNQFYVSGIKNGKYFSVLFYLKSPNMVRSLLVLCGERETVPFKSGSDISSKDFASWFKTVIQHKQDLPTKK